MPKQLGFLIDLSRCVGCHACEFACKNENQLEEISYRRIVDLKQSGNVFAYLSIACNHCANPQCIRVCPEGCFRKLRNGIVYYNHVHCDGCKRCIGACPFKVPKYNYLTKKINKCNLCYKRMNKGLKPACVSACAAEALKIVDMEGPLPGNCKKTIPSFAFIPLTNPSVRFLLPRETMCFWLKEKEVQG